MSLVSIRIRKHTADQGGRHTMKKQRFSIEQDGFFGTYYEAPVPSDCVMIGLLGDDPNDFMPKIGAKWLHRQGVSLLAMSPAKKDYSHVNCPLERIQRAIRKVPISHKAMAYWQYFLNKSDSEYLVSMDGRDFSGNKGATAYRNTYWKPFMETLEFGKRDIHETRHTCATMLAAAEVYDAKINRILGHSGKTVAENVYTHLDIQELVEAINMI